MNPILDEIRRGLVGETTSPLERPDFSDRFNTGLLPDEMAKYKEWVVTESAARGRDVGRDVFDYDLPGSWKAQQSFGEDARGHGPDTFKKPNHPTFSTGSKYADVGAGDWREAPGGMTTFVAGPSNLRHQTPEQLRSYFREVEPGVGLRTPTAPPIERLKSFTNILHERERTPSEEGR